LSSGSILLPVITESEQDAPTNLLYMRAFAEAYPEEEIVQAVLGQIIPNPPFKPPF